MKKILMLLFCVFIIVGCSKKEEVYDGYINNLGYKINEELTIEVKLKTSNTNISVCPIIKVEKEDEKDISKIIDNIEFSNEKVEFLNLYAKEYSESYNDDYWTFETRLSNDNENIDLSQGNSIIRLKITMKEKGNFKVSLTEQENNNFCGDTYGNSLNLSIRK